MENSYKIDMDVCDFVAISLYDEILLLSVYIYLQLDAVLTCSVRHYVLQYLNRFFQIPFDCKFYSALLYIFLLVAFS